MPKNQAWWDALEVRPRVVLPVSPLTQAVAQLQFPEKLSVHDLATVSKFQDAIDALYPESQRPISTNFQIALDAGGQPSISGSSSAATHVFHDQENQWFVSLSPISIGIDCQAYTGFQEFLDRFNFVVEACIDTIRPTLVRRLGLRYTNEIRYGENPEELLKCISPELRGALTLDPFLINTNRVFQAFELRADESRVNLGHGLIAIPDAQTAETPVYVIDIDVYQEYPKSSANEVGVSVPSITRELTKFHNVASTLFRWSTTEIIDTLGSVSE